MAEKLTQQLNQTDKKLADISKSRLGSVYKNIIKLPGLMEETIGLVSMSDYVTTTLVDIVDPTSFYNEYFYNTMNDYLLGSGTYRARNFGTMITENNGSVVFKEWYSVTVEAEAVNTTVKLRHTIGLNTSTKGYRDTMLRYVASGDTEFRDVIDIPHDVKQVNGTMVEIVFKPTVAGQYLLGMYSDTYECNRRRIQPLSITSLYVDGAEFGMVLDNTKHSTVNYANDPDINTMNLTTVIGMPNTTKKLYTGTSTTAGTNNWNTQRNLWCITNTGGYSEYVEISTGRLFYPVKNTPEALKVLVSPLMSNSVTVQYSKLYDDGTESTPADLSIANNSLEFTIAYSDAYTLAGHKIVGVMLYNVDVVNYNLFSVSYGNVSVQKTAFIKAIDTGNFKGKKFTCHYSNKLYVYCATGTPTGRKPFNISYVSRPNVTGWEDITVTDRWNNMYEVSQDEVGYFEFDQDVVLMASNIGAVQYPSSNGYYTGTSFTFVPDDVDTLYARYAGTDAVASGTVTIKYYKWNATTTVYDLITANVTMDTLNMKQVLSVASTGAERTRGITVTSTVPITLCGKITSSTGLNTTNGSSFVSAGMMIAPSWTYIEAPIMLPEALAIQYAVVNESTSTCEWYKVYDTTTSFNGTGRVSWKSFYGNVICYVSYSANGTTWTDEQIASNNYMLPTDGLDMDTRHIKVRFEITPGAWLVDIKLAYYTWQEL